jgi:hypothetical protein
MQRFVLAALMFALPAWAHEEIADHRHDAMKLAIAHFDASHSRGLDANSPEYAFMLDLLNSVGSQIPGVRPIYEICFDPEGNDPDPFANLYRQFTLHDPVIHRTEFEEAEKIRLAIESLGQGCPVDVETLTRSSTTSSGTSSSVRTKSTYDLISSTADCANPALAQKLLNLGITKLTFVQDPARGYATAYSHSKWNELRDLDFVRNRLLADPATSEFASLIRVVDTNPPLFGQERSTIDLIGSTGAAAFTDKILLNYRVGWGDCVSGCTNKHQWQIEVQPVASTGSAYNYVTSVVSETGDPVPWGGIPHLHCGLR